MSTKSNRLAKLEQKNINAGVLVIVHEYVKPDGKPTPVTRSALPSNAFVRIELASDLKKHLEPHVLKKMESEQDDDQKTNWSP